MRSLPFTHTTTTTISMTEPAPPPLPLRQDEQDAVLRAKLGIPERQLRLLPKRLSQILCAKGDAELAQAMLVFRLELEAFILQLERVEAVAKKTTVAEVQTYKDMVASMDQEKIDTLQSIEELKRELVHVQQERKNKLEYDQLASEIMKYGTRDELESQLSTLRTTIDSLVAESSNYTDIMEQSKSRFAGIASELKKLRADVGFEVGERERREVEREGEGDAEEEARAGEDAAEATATTNARDDAAKDDEGRNVNDKSGKLNASAPEFKPRHSSRASTPNVAEASRGYGSSSKRRRSIRRGDADADTEDLAQKRAREEGEMSEIDVEEEEEEGAA